MSYPNTGRLNPLEEKARVARLKVLEMVHKAQTSHIASNFSVIDIATVIYNGINPEDRVVWSKGWAAASVYYFMALRGEIPLEDLERFPNEPYLGLAETTVPGVLVNGGSVGHGLPIAAGIALAKKKSGEAGIVYCICSDGEMNEGTTWETAMFAAHHGLDNLSVYVDKNGWQAMGKTEDVINVDIVSAFKGFGWEAREVDGHGMPQLIKTKERPSGTPRAFVCKTIKGKGVSFMENHLLFHYRHVDKDEYERAKAELCAT
jgi:transketolase